MRGHNKRRYQALVTCIILRFVYADCVGQHILVQHLSVFVVLLKLKQCRLCLNIISGCAKSRQCTSISPFRIWRIKIAWNFYFIYCRPMKLRLLFGFGFCPVRMLFFLLLLASNVCIVKMFCMHAYSNSFPVNLRATDHSNTSPFATNFDRHVGCAVLQMRKTGTSSKAKCLLQMRKKRIPFHKKVMCQCDDDTIPQMLENETSSTSTSLSHCTPPRSGFIWIAHFFLPFLPFNATRFASVSITKS